MYTFYQAVEMAVNGTPMCNIEHGYYMKMDGNCLAWFYKCDDTLAEEVIITTDFLNNNFVPYVKKVKLTDNEKVILRNLPEEYKWIARDNDKTIWLYSDKPRKGPRSFISSVHINPKSFIFKHLFQQVKWEDAEPTLIADLLKE